MMARRKKIDRPLGRIFWDKKDKGLRNERLSLQSLGILLRIEENSGRLYDFWV